MIGFVEFVPTVEHCQKICVERPPCTHIFYESFDTFTVEENPEGQCFLYSACTSTGALPTSLGYTYVRESK